MFERRRFKLKFKKVYQFCTHGTWKEVSDLYLIKTLIMLQTKYQFDIVSRRFKNSFNNSYIVIKCNKEDKDKIFTEYCSMLDGQIDHISF